MVDRIIPEAAENPAKQGEGSPLPSRHGCQLRTQAGWASRQAGAVHRELTGGPAKDSEILVNHLGKASATGIIIV